MFARIGIPHSPETGLPIKSQTITEMVDQALKLKKNSKVYLLAPIIRERKGEYRKEFSELLKKGFQRVKVDGEFYEISDVPNLKRILNIILMLWWIELVINDDIKSRLADSFELATSYQMAWL